MELDATQALPGVDLDDSDEFSDFSADQTVVCPKIFIGAIYIYIYVCVLGKGKGKQSWLLV